jgi:hypothetical protein
LFGTNPRRTAFAQSVNGEISGTVFDPQLRPVSGATVRVIDQLNTTSQTAQTNEEGFFAFTELRPGKYTLSIEKDGFAELEMGDIGGDGAQVILTGNPVLPRSPRALDHFFNPNVFALPPKGQIGTAWNGGEFYGPGANNWDFVVARHLRFRERFDSLLRVETYNTFNHSQWSNVNNTALFDPSTGA